MTNLIYICEYNIDRSPVAEQITRMKIGEGHMHVNSAGLKKPGRYPYYGMTEEMREALSRSGYKLSKHNPRVLTSELLKEQDIILCMEKSHVKEVLEKAPGLERRVHTLPEYAGYSNKEILAPSELIGEFPLFSIFERIPYKARKLVYQLFGHVDSRDYNGIIGVHLKVVKEIELYVDKTLERMIREKFIPEPTPN